MAYGYLLAPSFQFVNINGRPLVGGHIEVFIHNTDTKYITKADFDGTDNPFKVPLNSKGMAVIIASGDFSYDVFCYDRFGSLFWSGSDVTIDGTGGAAIDGAELPMRIVGGKITNNGEGLTCTGKNAWAEGDNTTASGNHSHSEGSRTVASGDNAHAEGGATRATGEHSHAEGFRTKAGSYGHAEGAGTEASNSASHAEGRDTKASGEASHAEGRLSTASGAYSHASGFGTRATGEGSTAVGKYNSDGNALFSVGDGTDDDNRKDVFKVDREGNSWVMIGGVLTKVTNVSGGGGGDDGVRVYYFVGGVWYDANDTEVSIQDIIDATDGGATPIVVQMRGGGNKDSYYLIGYSPSNYIVLSNGSRRLTLDGTDETYSFDDSEETTIEIVEKIAEDLDKKITTTYPFAQIATMSDYAGYGVSSTTRMIGQLFAVPIASEIRKDETLLCVNALQNFSGKVSFGIFEYDFDANNGTGSTYWIADTGNVSVHAGENEFPLRHVNNDVHRLQSSKLYYAVVAIASDAPASGLLLASSPNYAANYNANPKYTLLVSNMDNYIDWTTGELSGAWFQGYNEDNTIPRLFMMLRNGEGSTPIPITEPFTDIGAFTLQHQYRVSDIFSLTPDAQGGIYRKVIPAQDVDIVSFRYVDYHGSVGSQSSFPVLLDDTYTPMKTIGDGSWTLGDSDQTKIDGTHYVHEFTFSTPVHLTANTAYWFLVGGNLSNQGNDWLITYQSPSVVNDLLLVKNMYNVSQWIIPLDGEFQSQQPGMYLRLNDGINSWVI